MNQKIDLKVVILGRSNAGKSSLMEKYLTSKFQIKNNSTTIGASFGCKKVQTKNKLVNMGIWDTAGSERYESMTQMYYRNASAAIICFDLTDLDSFKRVDYWLKQLRQFEQSCRVFLCGTKLDLLESEVKDYANDNMLFYQANDQVLKNKIENNSINKVINEEQIEVYCKHNDIINYLPTSSKSGYNVDEIFQAIADDWIEQQILIENERRVSQHNEEEEANSIIVLKSNNSGSKCC